MTLYFSVDRLHAEFGLALNDRIWRGKRDPHGVYVMRIKFFELLSRMSCSDDGNARGKSQRSPRRVVGA